MKRKARGADGRLTSAPKTAGRGVTVSSIPGTTLDFLKVRRVR